MTERERFEEKHDEQIAIWEKKYGFIDDIQEDLFSLALLSIWQACAEEKKKEILDLMANVKNTSEILERNDREIAELNKKIESLLAQLDHKEIP